MTVTHIDTLNLPQPEGELLDPRPRRWTRREYYLLTEAGVLGPEDRVELIDGEILQMSAQHSPHFATVGLVAAVLRTLFPADYYVREQMPIIAGEASEPEPDLAVVPGSPRDYVTEHPREAVVIVEVSDSTLAYDRGRKASLYAQAGVEDYWIVDLVHRCIEVRRDPVPMPAQPLGYGYRTILIFQPGQEISPLGAPDALAAVDDLLP